MDTNIINKWIDNNKEDILERLSKLIQIKTINYGSHGNEKPGQEYIYDFISKFIPEKDIDIFDLDEVEDIRENPMFVGTIDGVEREYKDRPNLVAKLKGSGGSRSISFNGHIDIIEAKEEKWDTFENPYSGKIKDGKMYGRGAIDMKGGIISNFFALKCLKDLNIDLKGDVYAESIVDEELGGVNGTIAARLRYPDIDFSIITEPTDLRVGIESAGGSIWKATFTEKGPGGYSQYTNPIRKISEFVLMLEEYNEYRNSKIVYLEDFVGEKYLRMLELAIYSGGRDCLENASYLPKTGKFYFLMYARPNTPEEVLWEDFLSFFKKRIQKSKYLKDDFPEIERCIRYFKGHSTDLNHSGMNALRNAYNLLKMDYIEKSMFYLCDAQGFDVVDTGVVIVGPTGDKIHGIDEYVEVESIFETIKILVATSIDYCS